MKDENNNDTGRAEWFWQGRFFIKLGPVSSKINKYKKHRNHENNNKKTQEEAPKSHFIIAFGNRTDAGDTVHLQPR